MRLPLLLTGTLVLAVSGCQGSIGAEGGPTIQRGFPVNGAFTALSVTGPYDVKVVSGGTPGVAASGHEKALDALVVEVSGGTLAIHPAPQSGGGLSWGNTGKAQITVTVPNLDSAVMAGSGAVDVDKVTGARFKGTVTGSGDLRLAAVDTQDLELSVAGSGDVRAEGKATTVRFNVAGSGDLDAGKLTAQSAQVSISGSGDVRARATTNAAVSTQGSGDVEISGGARCSISKNGSGDVRCS